MEHIKKFNSFKSDDQVISEGATDYTVITDKLVKQHFGKTIKEIRELSVGGKEYIKIIFTDGSELEITAFPSGSHSASVNFS